MRTAATLVAVLAVLGVAHASPSALKCATAATQLGACRSPPLAALAPAATETACCKPFLELLLSDCFCKEEASGLASAALTQDAAVLILNNCPVTTFESPCGDPLLKATLSDGLQAQQAAFLQHLQTDTEDREILGAKFAADAEQFPELQKFLKPAGALRDVLKAPQPRSQTPPTSVPQFPAWIKTVSGAGPAHRPSTQAQEEQRSQPCLRQHGLTPQTLKELLGSDPHAADYLQPRAVATQLRGVSQQAQQAALQLRAAFGQQAEGAVQSMEAAQDQDAAQALTGTDSALGQLRKASRTVEAVASYLRALGDSTSDATAIDLDVGVSSQHLDEESLFRVQEGADGTSFVLEFTLDADDAEAEQLVQAGYDILAGATPRGDDAFARQFKSRDMRLVAGALEELFESVAKRGKALRAANPTTFQMDLTVAVANEDGPRQEQALHESAGEAGLWAAADEDAARILAVQDLTMIPATEEERQFLCALEAGDATPCRPPRSPLSPAWLSFLGLAGLMTRATALVAVVAILATTVRKLAAARRLPCQGSSASRAEEADEEPLLKPFAPESAFHILPTHTAAHYSPV